MKKMLSLLIVILILSACSLNNSISQSEAEKIALKETENSLDIKAQELKVSNIYQEDFYHKEKDVTYKDTWHIMIDNNQGPLFFYYIDSKDGEILAKGEFNK